MSKPIEQVDTLILGAGAAGLFCGAQLARGGGQTLVVDHARRPAEKVRISGGGRCNFTNLHTRADAFLSDNPHFAKSALARYSPWDFCDLMSRHGLSWHEKTLGQLFCDQKSGAIIQMLLDEASGAGAALWLDTPVGAISHGDGGFTVDLNGTPVFARHLVVATGGLSIPKMGATGLAYDIARQFGHAVITPRPALVPFTFTGPAHDTFATLAGVSHRVAAQAQGGPAFAENMLFTHRGLSGPAMLQVSSYWQPGEDVTIDLAPGAAPAVALRRARSDHPRQSLRSFLGEHMPTRLVAALGAQHDWPLDAPLASLSNAFIDAVASRLSAWTVRPAGTEGWRTAEVTAGGIDTAGLSSKSMQSQHVEGLFFIGECVDVTGWLGGYNFQWAWASAYAAARHINALPA